MPLGVINTKDVKLPEAAPADTKSSFMSESRQEGCPDYCYSNGWGEESAEDEKAIRDAELYQAKQELKEAFHSLGRTLCSGTSLATLMGFTLAVIGFIRFLSFKDIWTDGAILLIGLAIYAIFRKQ